jgi:phosphinothricin acetyltransferase
VPNDPSEGLHRALGFAPVGTYRRIGWKHGAWRDVTWMQLDLGDEQELPAEPR